MNVEGWAIVIFGSVVTPSIAWLVKEVIGFRRDITRIQTLQEERHITYLSEFARMDSSRIELSHSISGLFRAKEDECQRHKDMINGITATVARLDRNIVRLCEKLQTEYEPPK